VLTSRILKIVAAASSGIAMFALSLLPAEHLHRSASGPSVIHRHVMEEAVEAHHDSETEGVHIHASLHHDDHANAETLTQVFVAERQYVSLAPLVVAILLLPPPEPRVVERIVPDAVPLAHGPPIRLLSLRGPPA
jgi:hypothetical protein